MDTEGVDQQPADERPGDAADSRERGADGHVLGGALGPGDVDDRHHPHELETHGHQRVGDGACDQHRLPAAASLPDGAR